MRQGPQAPGQGGPPDVGATDAAEVSRKHIRGSSVLLVGRALSLVFTVATQVLLVRALSRADYGAFAYALALVAAGRIVLSLGQGKMLSRFMARYEEQQEYGRMFGAMVLAAGTVIVMGVLALTAVALSPASFLPGDAGSDAALDVLVVLVVLAPLEALDQVFVALFAVFTRPQAIFFRKYLFTPLLRLVVVLALVLTSSSVVFLAAGYVLAQVLGLLLYVHMLVGVLRARGLLEHFRPSRLELPFREVLTFSVPTLSRELVLVSVNTGSVLVLQAAQGLAAVAGYRAVFPAARLNQFFFASLSTLFLPSVARLHTRGDLHAVRDIYWSTALFLAVFTFPVYALTGPFAEMTTVALFGERYAESAPVLALLATGYYVNIAFGYNAYTVQMFGRLRYLLVVDVLTAAGNLALSLVLASRWGAVGVAVANCATLVAQNLLYQVALARGLSCGLVTRPLLGPYACIAAAAAALFAVSELTTPGLPAALAISAVTSLALLVTVRRSLRLGATYPELLRVPVLRSLFREQRL